MALSPTSSRGTTFNGGTITGTLIVENDIFDVLLQTSAGRALLVSSGNEIQMGVDGITAEIQIDPAQAGSFLVHGTGNIIRVQAGPDTIGFFGHAEAAQPAAIPNAAGGAIIDAEARTALNALLAALRSYGLIAT